MSCWRWTGGIAAFIYVERLLWSINTSCAFEPRKHFPTIVGYDRFMYIKLKEIQSSEKILTQNYFILYIYTALCFKHNSWYSQKLATNWVLHKAGTKEVTGTGRDCVHTLSTLSWLRVCFNSLCQRLL